jgi:hypothetical protein
VTLASMSPEVSDRFDALCRAVCSRGKGMTLAQLGDCHALARELGEDEPDQERVALFVRRLDLDPEALP